MQKETPRTVKVPHSNKLEPFISLLERFLNGLMRNVRNDLDNGTMTYPWTDIAGIANVSTSDFDIGEFKNSTQIRFYVDTSDSNRKYMCVRNASTIYKVELT
jgi:hypothetical protein